MVATRENKSIYSEKHEGQIEPFIPPPVNRMEDTGLSGFWLQDLTLWYIRRNHKLRGSHPRDICEQILDVAHYLDVEPGMSNEMIDRAGRAFFVNL